MHELKCARVDLMKYLFAKRKLDIITAYAPISQSIKLDAVAETGYHRADFS